MSVSRIMNAMTCFDVVLWKLLLIHQPGQTGLPLCWRWVIVIGHTEGKLLVLAP